MPSIRASLSNALRGNNSQKIPTRSEQRKQEEDSQKDMMGHIKGNLQFAVGNKEDLKLSDPSEIAQELVDTVIDTMTANNYSGSVSSLFSKSELSDIKESLGVSLSDKMYKDVEDRIYELGENFEREVKNTSNDIIESFEQKLRIEYKNTVTGDIARTAAFKTTSKPINPSAVPKPSITPVDLSTLPPIKEEK